MTGSASRLPLLIPDGFQHFRNFLKRNRLGIVPNACDKFFPLAQGISAPIYSTTPNLLKQISLRQRFRQHIVHEFCVLLRARVVRVHAIAREPFGVLRYESVPVDDCHILILGGHLSDVFIVRILPRKVRRVYINPEDAAA